LIIDGLMEGAGSFELVIAWLAASLKKQKKIGAMIEAAHGLDLLGTD
jgi:hypothetical protein